MMMCVFEGLMEEIFGQGQKYFYPGCSGNDVKEYDGGPWVKCVAIKKLMQIRILSGNMENSRCRHTLSLLSHVNNTPIIWVQ